MHYTLRRGGQISHSKKNIFTNAIIISTAAKAKVVVKVVHINVPVAQVTLDRGTQSQQVRSAVGQVEDLEVPMGSHCAKPLRAIGAGAERAA